MKHEGKLKPPAPDDKDEEEIEEVYVDADQEAHQQQADLHEIAKDLSVEWNVNEWIAVIYDNEWYPGEIKEVYTLLYYNLVNIKPEY